MDIVTSDICCRRPEFRAAVELFEDQGVDGMITLHLAYSPSLESIDALSSTKIPLIILNTTPDYDFGPTQDPDNIYLNIAIHGVQDLCNLLKRRGKRFFIEAGHWERSDVLDRVISRAKQAKMASSFLSTRVGLIGKPLDGMGDFRVPESLLKTKYGFSIIKSSPGDIYSIYKDVFKEEIEDEALKDSTTLDNAGIDKELYHNTIKAGLAIRKWIEKESLNAYSLNYMNFGSGSKIPYVPFLEASKAMARGTGYAGEGDILTSSLYHSLATIYPDSTFTEMFCPDWKGNSIFLSHYGEVNLNILKDRPKLIVKDYPLIKTRVVIAAGRLKEGLCSIVDIAPIEDNRFTLIISKGQMMPPKSKDNFSDYIHGWFKPDTDLEGYLSQYSSQGGTHHSVVVYGDDFSDIEGFGKYMGWDIVWV